MSFQILSDIKQIDIKKWDDFVKNHSEGNFFQTPSLYQFFTKVKNQEPKVVICQSKDGNITGSLMGVIQKDNFGPFTYLTARTVVWGGPLVSDLPNKKEITGLLLKEFNSILSKKSIFIQFRNLFDLSEYQDVFEKNGYTFRQHLNFVVNTTSKEETIQNLSKSKWRQIKKAFVGGASIGTANSIEEVKDFYLILKKLYKTKVKQPLPSWSFFELFFNYKELGNYLFVKYKGEVIGGILCPVFGKKADYEWYVCGRDEEFKELYPSILATWAALEYAADNQIKSMNFLGAGSPDKDYGVREFKSKFGGELVNHGRFSRVNSKALYSIGKIGLKFYKTLSII